MVNCVWGGGLGPIRLLTGFQFLANHGGAGRVGMTTL